MNLESINNLLMDIDNKLNRTIYRNNQKKLLKSFYLNMEFQIDINVKIKLGFLRFYLNDDFYLIKYCMMI